MIKSPNIQLTSNVYPVKAEDDDIDFSENIDFIARVWNREALIKLFQYVYHMTPDKRILGDYIRQFPGLNEWQIRRINTPDECSFMPGEKPWGIVIGDGTFKEVCKCNKRDCSEFAKCRPNIEAEDDVKE